MKHITERAGAMSARVLTPDERAIVDDVLDAAAEWRLGRMPWQDAARVHDHRARFLATTTTDRSDPRWHALQRLLDALTDATGYVRTRQGCFSRYELGERGVVVHVALRKDAA